MTEGPYTWEVQEDMVIDLFVGDPNTGKGLTGQTSFITLTVQKKSDSRWWDGSTWLPSMSSTSMTEVDATNQPGLYRHIVPGATNNGNFEADVYYVHASISNFPTVEGDDYSIHVSRDLAQDVRVYESEPEFVIRSE